MNENISATPDKAWNPDSLSFHEENDRELNLLRERLIEEGHQLGYASRITDIELTECVTYLHSEETNLPCDIIVDTEETYKVFCHPLCLYVVEGEKVIPVDVVREIETVPDGVPAEIIGFIRDNYDTLCLVADMKIDGFGFFDRIEAWASGK